ncbi:hypothetical protein EJ04DRAFT_521546 [Polyplosphaeria fusca]|uniref:Uncharacterized protein n=1 Tax=Polyplosphaeria fusca TaxID=682080 RepID=A0A9P4R558_9PLEO|nr:hypothetical protein EJ04DRAFT_521546 [Polyplosphaeria fusca]
MNRGLDGLRRGGPGLAATPGSPVIRSRGAAGAFRQLECHPRRCGERPSSATILLDFAAALICQWVASRHQERAGSGSKGRETWAAGQTGWRDANRGPPPAPSSVPVSAWVGYRQGGPYCETTLRALLGGMTGQRAVGGNIEADGPDGPDTNVLS